MIRSRWLSALSVLTSVAVAAPVAAQCAADLDGDGTVGAADIAMLLASYGEAAAADLDGDGMVSGVDLGRAVRAMSDAMGSVNDLSAAAYLSASVAAAVDVPEDTVVLRLEGFGASIKYRAEQVAALVSGQGSAELLEDQASAKVWTKIRDVAPFWSHDGALWRLSIAPGDAPQVIAQLQQEIDMRYYLDWQGGLAWLAVPEGEEAAASQIRHQVNAVGGHATLVKASAQCRAHVPVFHPQPSGLAALSGRLKAQFDPENILNPGRMGAF